MNKAKQISQMGTCQGCRKGPQIPTCVTTNSGFLRGETLNSNTLLITINISMVLHPFLYVFVSWLGIGILLQEVKSVSPCTNYALFGAF